VFLGLVIHLLFFPKGNLVVFLDRNHNASLDLIFPYVTNIGDGVSIGIIILLLLFCRNRWFLGALFGIAILVLCIQLGKNFFFDAWPRPREYFKDTYVFREIKNLKVHKIDSMPSGHTAASFFIFSFLAFISEKRAYGYVTVFLASLVGFSRMYLGQHFPEDVLVGSILGISCSLAAYYLFIARPWLDKKAWADKPFFRF
jgi:membrane-associated phospholipid phosphatase